LAAEYWNEKNRACMMFVPIVNYSCAAINKVDFHWHRGKILKIHENLDVDVLFVDYGNVERVSFKNIRKIRPKYLKFTVNTFKCRLFGLSYENDKKKRNQAFDMVAKQTKDMNERTG
jgi:hypothetical protein